MVKVDGVWLGVFLVLACVLLVMSVNSVEAAAGECSYATSCGGSNKYCSVQKNCECTTLPSNGCLSNSNCDSPDYNIGSFKGLCFGSSSSPSQIGFGSCGKPSCDVSGGPTCDSIVCAGPGSTACPLNAICSSSAHGSTCVKVTSSASLFVDRSCSFTTVPVCGDGTCSSSENANNCAADCSPVCGNGVGELGETCSNCPVDVSCAQEFGGLCWGGVDLSGLNVHGFDDVQFVDSNNGWAVGSKTIHTSDGGETWATQYTSPQSSSAVFFVDINKGWVVKPSGDIFVTSNAGTTWELQRDGELNDNLNDIFFTDSNNGWAVGWNGNPPNTPNIPIIFHTTDGGANWVGQTVPSGGLKLHAVYFTDSSNGFAVGLSNVGGGEFLLKTNDGGATWSRETPGVTVTKQLFGVDFFDDFGLTVGHDRGYKTLDGGSIWQSIGTDLSGFNDIEIIDGDNAWAVGQNGANIGKIFKTVNGGSSWASVSSFTRALNAVDFIDATNGYAVSIGGVLLKGGECPAVCGDGVVEGDEQCDGGACCLSNCQIATPEQLVACRGSAGSCDSVEYCDGTLTCPNDVVEIVGTECRSGVDSSCNPAESCDGVSTSCPTDVTGCTGGLSCQYTVDSYVCDVPPPGQGDVNGDGFVDEEDAYALARHVLSVHLLDGKSLCRSNIDCSDSLNEMCESGDSISMNDVLSLLSKINSGETYFGCME